MGDGEPSMEMDGQMWTLKLPADNLDLTMMVSESAQRLREGVGDGRSWVDVYT